jgi:enoyl-[acyl-carrier protein] reductase I
MSSKEDQSIAELQPVVIKGKRALVLGIANEHSIAYGCARVFRKLGAELAITYATDKSRAYVEPLAKELDAKIFRRCDVSTPGDLESLFEEIGSSWGSLDIALHSIAFAPKDDLHGRVVDSSAEGFRIAMDVSCHSFIRMARLAEPLMLQGGSLLCMSYHGANKVVPNYNLMGPVKAALESAVRYLAFELGEKQIRVHAISPGPLKTRAASGIKDFGAMLAEASERSPIGELVDIDDVGLTTAFLTTPFARRLTGTVTYVDGGLNIMA